MAGPPLSRILNKCPIETVLSISAKDLPRKCGHTPPSQKGRYASTTNHITPSKYSLCSSVIIMRSMDSRLMTRSVSSFTPTTYLMATCVRLHDHLPSASAPSVSSPRYGHMGPRRQARSSSTPRYGTERAGTGGACLRAATQLLRREHDLPGRSFN
jgi:hypothetical protein